MKTIDIAGAGPAGLSAAIVLARRGHAVRVFERRHAVGMRFHDDFQGIENWTTPADCLEELRALGIQTTWWQHTFDSSEIRDAEGRCTPLRSNRPLFYLTRRGPRHPGSLDNALLAQARALGVELCFNRAASPGAVRIFAGGPVGRPVAVVRGTTFAADAAERACTWVCDHLTPAGYAYLLVADGQVTLGAVLLENFRDANARLEAAIQAAGRQFGIHVPAQAIRWGGYADFRADRFPCREEGLRVGEAAGYQDALFGFGIRTAMLSGAIAAVAIDEHRDYHRDCSARLMPFVQASLVNRQIYRRFNVAKKMLPPWLAATRDGVSGLRWLYSRSLLHRVLSPWAAWEMRREALGSRA